jgi:hypothetical protein
MKSAYITIIYFSIFILCSCVSLREYKRVKKESFQKDTLISKLRNDSAETYKAFKNLDDKYFTLNETNNQLKSLIENQSNVYGFPSIPIISVPPPQPTDYLILTNRIANHLKKYSKIDSLISHSFDVNNYKKIYFGVSKGGFAIATEFEEITASGKKIESELKSSSSVVDFFLRHINDLFFSRPGFYRCIVFIISSNIYQLGGNKISYDELVNWLNLKTIALPPNIAQLSFSKPPQIVALMYEFEKNQNTKTTTQVLNYLNKNSQLKDNVLIKTLLNEK